MYIRHILPEPEHGVLPLDPLNAPISGAALTTFQLAVRQAADGHRVEIIGPIQGEKSQSHTVANVQIHWIALKESWRLPRYDLRYMLPLLWYLRRMPVADVTHVHSNPFLLTRMRTRSTVFHFQSQVLTSSYMYNRALSRADRVICPSNYIQHDVLSKTNYPQERILTVYNAIDVSSFAGLDRAAARAQFNVPADRQVIVYAGRVAPEKGLDVLLKALRTLVNEGYDKLHLLVAGSKRFGYSRHFSEADFDAVWPGLRQYEEEITRLSADLPVQFAGDVAQPDMPTFYAAGDIFVCPSVWQEPFGRTNIEAMAVGIPVVASAVGGIPEIVREGENGFLFPARDDVALASQLRQLLDDSDLSTRFGEQSRLLAAWFDWPVIARQVEQIYTTILGTTIRRGG